VNLPKLEIEVQEMSVMKTLIAFNPNRDIVEDRPRKTEYKIKEIQMVLSKATIGFNKILDINEYYRLIFFFKYPKFSFFCMFSMIVFTLFFDPAYFLSYMIAIFLVFYLSHNQKTYSNFEPILHKLFFNKITPYLKAHYDKTK
jgi:hypothetical protein